MNFTAFGWSVVIIGRWNPAILTPAGISKRVFKCPPGTQVHVDVPLDGVSPYRVKAPSNDYVAMVNDQRLILELVRQNYAALERAMQAGINAITSLPETPISAAGFNLRFRATEPSEAIKTLLTASIDNELSDLRFEIEKRSFHRTLQYEGGSINMIIEQNQAETQIGFNFHRGSAKADDIQKWLSIPKAAILEQVNKIATTLKIQTEEQLDDTNN
jgi:hypothetical protein